MTQNIKTIKNELKNCQEITSVYDLKKDQIIKYITLKQNDEYFYTGGKFIRMGNNKIFYNQNGSTKSCQLVWKNKDGSINYKSRIFVKKDQDSCTKDIQELKKIINNQQMIIEKMNLKLKEQDQIIKFLQNKINK
jgi:hypothetical protein|tara:strand:- start:214 stop:618 length:405 start_codon:yes stop_codon:yes gene_type:complete